MNCSRDFLHPRLVPNAIDKYHIRQRIVQALTMILPHCRGTLLDLGCGLMPYKPLFLLPPSQVSNYIGLDLEGNIYQKPDVVWDGKTIPLEESTIDCVIATEVFEHCPDLNGILQEVYRVLKPEGFIFFTVPFLWNLHDVPHDEYRYTPFALERILSACGFAEIQIAATGGWDASLAQMLGLWARRRFYGGGRKFWLFRTISSVVLFPIVWLLYKIDQPPETFEEGTMITGLTGTACKP